MTLLDPLLLLATFAAVAWAFGAEATLLAVIHFCVIFGATFGWTGGAFLRFVWFFCVVAALCSSRAAGIRWREPCSRSRRCSASSRRFSWLGSSSRRPSIWWPPGAFAGGRGGHWRAFAATAAVLVLLTLPAFGGIESWRDFERNLDRHVDTVSPNIVGLTQLLHKPAARPETVTAPELRQIREDRSRLYDRLLVTVFPVALLVAAGASLVISGTAAAALGVPALSSARAWRRTTTPSSWCWSW